ncbi:MAG: protein kinase [Chloroflexi bacterium]|nr:protein kinase [Chloroflexota bacterium]
MAIPTKIGRYEIKSELGRGGMATVYRGYDPSFDREVAIKVLPREMMHDPQFRVRFEREIKMIAGLEHPSIVPVYDVGDEDGQPYFVMRFMTGGSLSDMIDKGKVPMQETARIVERIALGLTHAHKKGIVHRDLKPDNILFDENGDPFISDFGVAKLTESTGNLTGSGVIGTPAYMSPEQAQGNDIDGRSDVYGLGVIVYQMLSGSQPYNADTPMGVVVKHITEPVPEILKMIPDLPHEVDGIIKLSMAKDRNKRYASAVDLAKALNLLAFGHEGNLTISGTGIHTGTYKAAATPSGKSKTGLIVGGMVLLVVIAGVFLLRNQLFGSPQAAPTLTVAPTEAPTLTPAASSTESVASPLPFAPACASGVTLPLPSVEETNNICVQKIPYTGVAISQGATFESLNPDFTCTFETTTDGKDIISCRGVPSFAFDLKVCLPPPPPAADDLNKCAQGSLFDKANQCCIAVPPKDAGCVVTKINIRSCP